jgi:signal transduction histidine kinase
MEELVQRMLQLARFEQEPASTQVRCDLAEIAHDIVAQMETFAAIRNVTIDLLSPDSLLVPLSEDACVSLLSNLLMNSIQHTPEGGRAKASLVTGKEIVLEVSDTGCGIAAEDLPHLFERFWRGDRSRARSTGGAGLGLAICKAIVDSCGGEIEITSSPGKGTRVTVRLPFAPEEPLLLTRSVTGEPSVRG